MEEFVSAVEDAAAEDSGEEPTIQFKLDGRVMTAYHPDEMQLTFLMASFGRGRSNENRFADILNVLLACLKDEDSDYLSGRLLERGAIKPKTLQNVFEYLMGEWFDRPTVPSSGSTSSQESDGQNSTPPTTTSQVVSFGNDLEGS